MKPGTLPWLLRYELLLMWRSLGKLTRAIVIVVVALGGLYLVGTGALGLHFFFRVRESLTVAETPDGPPMTAIFLWLALAAQLLMWTLSLFQAMKQSIESLFERGDIDLLLSSPMRGEVIFSSRLIAIAATIFASWLPLAIPAIGIGITVGFPQILGTLPTLACMASLSASVGILLVLALVRAIGLKRARVAGQIIASLIGVSFFLGYQAIYWSNIKWFVGEIDPEVAETTATETTESVMQLMTLFTDGGPLNAQNPLLFPARALVFDLPSLLLLIGLSAIAFWLTVKIAYRSFLRSTQQSTHRDTRKRARRTAPARFQPGLVRTLLLKEWRSIWRNPFLVSRTLLQVLYLIPATVLILSGTLNVGPNLSSQIGLISVYFGSSLVAALTGICVNGEEAADLLASAPVSGDRLRVIKLVAAITPVWLLIAPMYVWLIWHGAERWEWVAIAFMGGTISTAAIQLWSAIPLPRADLMKKTASYQVADLWLSVMAIVNLFAWPAAAIGWGASKFWGWPGFAIGALMTLAAYARSKTVGSKLGY